jgi:hypothetical protein
MADAVTRVARATDRIADVVTPALRAQYYRSLQCSDRSVIAICRVRDDWLGSRRHLDRSARNGCCPAPEGDHVQHDGLGTRRAAHDARLGHVEILDVSQELSTPIAELAIRTAASRMPRTASVLSPVHAIERTGSSLRVITGVVDGRRLSDLLEALEAQALRLPDEALLELGAMVVTTVRWMHETPGTTCHGAVSAAHMVLKENGQLMLTDGVFADALSRLRVSRDHLWREYGLAIPATGDPAFDQRADITGTGAVVLALMLRRPLRAAEYPTAIPDLLMAATASLPEWGPPLRSWLQQALHLRTPFSTSAECSASFAGVLQTATRRREGARALLSELFSPVRVG